MMPESAISRTFISLGAFSSALAIMLGAFGAHALRARVQPDLLAVYQTAAQYHMYHSLALILIGLVAARFSDPSRVALVGWLMVAGIVLFSGSLYLMSVTGLRWLGAVTPLGGLAFIVGWLLLGFRVVRG